MFTTNTSATVALTNICQNYIGASITVVAPGPGHVVVTGSMSVLMSHANGTADTVQVGIGTSTTDCGSTFDRSLIQIPAAEATFPFSLEHTVMTQRVYSVSAGAATYYLNGVSLSGWGSTDDMYWGSLTVTFVPD